ncbi:MAG: hypothetical protein AAGH57_13435 [Pseudomonadota bacterium]
MVVSGVLVASLADAVWAEPVSINHSGEDAVGARLAFELVQEIIRHPALSAGSEIDPGWKVVLHTVETAGSTTFSVSLVKKAPDQIFDYFVNSFVGVCGSKRVKSCAQSVIARIEEPIALHHANWKEFPGTQRQDNPPEIVKIEE